MKIRCAFISAPSLSILTSVPDRVARFLLVHDTQTGKNVPNEYKMYQMVTKYPTSPQKIPNGNKIYTNIFQSKALQNRPKLGFLV
jgi:hypothetical protein